MANHNTGPGLQSGGMTVYYFQPNGNAPITAFKKVCTLISISFAEADVNIFILIGLPHASGKR